MSSSVQATSTLLTTTVVGEYSSTSFSAASPEFVPSACKASAAGEIGLDYPDQEDDAKASAKLADSAVKSPPWRQVPWRQKNTSTIEVNDSADAQAAAVARGGKSPPWRQAALRFCDEDGEPSRQLSSVSTCVGSPATSTCAGSQAGSSHDSDASDQEHASGDEGDDATLAVSNETDDEQALDLEQPECLSIQAMMRWRHACDHDIDLDHQVVAGVLCRSEKKCAAMPNAAAYVQQAFVWPRAEEVAHDNQSWMQQRSKLNGSAKPFEPKFHFVNPQMSPDVSAPVSSPDHRGAPPSKEGAPKLKSSESSWAAQQAARRAAKQGTDNQSTRSDAEVVRAIKSILNKLTVEKFPQLCEKLLTCGICTASHLETLMQEVFEKATTQHGFISVYADLCVRLQSHFARQPVADDPKLFKTLLLNTCQASFERHLKAPANVDSLAEDERANFEHRCKTQMLGNIKFVGALLVRQVLASKVMVGIVEELFSGSTPLMLELLAALLTVIGPTFDTPEWAGRRFFEDVFERLSSLSSQDDVNARVRCLLKDVIELRAAGWQERLPKKAEGPSTLKEVADTFAAEAASNSATPTAAFSRRWHGDQRDWRSGSSPVASKATQAAQPARPPGSWGDNFDQNACRAEIALALAELRAFHDVTAASARVAALAVPLARQADAIGIVLGLVAEESAHAVRKLCLEVVVRLFMDGHWQPSALGKGLRSFLDICADLKIDVPELRDITEELLSPKTKKGRQQAA